MTSRGRWAAIGVLLIPAVVLPLWVSLYDREDPTLFGFPFFYWAQLAFIVIGVSTTALVYQLTKRRG
jgi:hypothetical protein